MGQVQPARCSRLQAAQIAIGQQLDAAGQWGWTLRLTLRLTLHISQQACGL